MDNIDKKNLELPYVKMLYPTKTNNNNIFAVLDTVHEDDDDAKMTIITNRTSKTI